MEEHTTINEIADEYGIEKWWQTPLPPYSIIHKLPLKE